MAKHKNKRLLATAVAIANEEAVKSNARKKKEEAAIKITFKPVNFSKTQMEFVKKIQNNDITFVFGPAGSSKTFSTCYTALQLLQEKRVSQIIITKPIQESGEKLGFLPGTMDEKVLPYLESFYGNMEKIIGKNDLKKLIENEKVVAKPLAYMRGTAQPIDELVVTPSGYKKIGDLKINDYVIGSDGKQTEVIGIFPQGEKEIYKITFTDNYSVECCSEHLWNTKNLNELRNEKWHTRTTKELLNNFIDKYNRKFYRIPIVNNCVEFETRNVDIEPYLLGLMLGDGTLSEKATLMFATADEELVDSIKNIIPENMHIKYNSKYDYSISNLDRHQKNSIKQSLKKYGLLGKKSNEKLIPEDYKLNSVECRLNILRGLLDTDGSVFYHKSGKNRVQYYTTSEQLKNDVVFIVQSLGGICNVLLKPISKGAKFINDREFHSQYDMYVIDIKLPKNIIPFNLKRKKELYKQTPECIRQIKNIEYVEKKEAVCIKVKNDDGLYLTNNFIVTHNTYDNSVMILDEAQNCDFRQLMLYISRMGKNSKVIIAGDISQSDIEEGAIAMPKFIEMVTGVPNVAIQEFQKGDIVRNPILIEITDRYETWKKNNLITPPKKNGNGNGSNGNGNGHKNGNGNGVK